MESKKYLIKNQASNAFCFCFTCSQIRFSVQEGLSEAAITVSEKASLSKLKEPIFLHKFSLTFSRFLFRKKKKTNNNKEKMFGLVQNGLWTGIKRRLRHLCFSLFLKALFFICFCWERVKQEGDNIVPRLSF